MAAHRYWRIYITNTTGSASFLDIREIEMRTSIGGADVTGSGTATASTQGSGFEAPKAFDNNSSTTWFTNIGTNPLPQWIKYDFGAGSDKDIVEVALQCWAATEHPSCWELQYSDDNLTWSRSFLVESSLGWSANEWRSFSANTGPSSGTANKQFWRVRSTAVDGGTVFGLSELQMFTTPGGSNQCSGGAAWCSNSPESAGPAAEAFDGVIADSQLGSYWAGGSTKEWIGYKFASAKDIVSIKVSARVTNQNQSPKDFVVEYWDGSAYQTAYTVTASSGWASGETRTFTWGTGPSARPVVFVCT
jgi:hypothetical protein